MDDELIEKIEKYREEAEEYYHNIILRDKMLRVKVSGRSPSLIIGALIYIFARQRGERIPRYVIARYFGRTDQALGKTVKHLSKILGLTLPPTNYPITPYEVAEVTKLEGDILKLVFRRRHYKVTIYLNEEGRDKLIKLLKT